MELINQKGYDIPVHTLPPEKWDEVVCKGLIPRILILLSIDVSKNQERIAATEEMIRDTARRMTAKEIEFAFLAYVKNQLPIEPRDNYLTPILFNKVIKLYTEQSKPKKNTKMDEIEIDEVLFAYGEYKETKALLPPNQRCFDFLLKKGVFKNGREISGKTGKPWQHWYTYLSKKALPLAVAYAIDQKMDPKERNLVRQGKHDLCHAFVKLEALKVYFKRFNDRNQLKSALLAL